MKNKKRVKLIHLLIQNICIVIALTLLFGAGYREYIRKDMIDQIKNANSEYSLNIIKRANISELRYADPFCQIDTRMTLDGYFDIILEDIFGFENIIPYFQNPAAIIDENNNIVASNRMKLAIFLKFGDDDENKGFYQCDNEKINIPEVQQLYDEYYSLLNSCDETDEIEIEVRSAYVDRENFMFIPHKGDIKIYINRYTKKGEVLFETLVPDKVIDIDIDYNDENYELIDLTDESIHSFLNNFFGIPKEKFDELTSSFSFMNSNSYTRNSIEYDDETITVASNNPIYIGNKEYFLCTKYIVNTNTPEIQRFYWIRVSIFFIALLIIAVAVSLIKNAENKAAYAFEDYQKALTNNLAHDIKTPLTAISGYAENMLNTVKSGDTQKSIGYISAILENVSYTDNIVNRTLELNHIREIREIKKTPVNLRELAEKIIEKYDLMLKEKNITVNFSGEMEISADEVTISSAVENLISNAVKYTIENGKIEISLDKKSFTISNDIAEKVNTNDLTMPFVVGDKARGKHLGSGLGLSIVQNAAYLNDMKLNLSSSNNKFSAKLSK